MEQPQSLTATILLTVEQSALAAVPDLYRGIYAAPHSYSKDTGPLDAESPSLTGGNENGNIPAAKSRSGVNGHCVAAMGTLTGLV